MHLERSGKELTLPGTNMEVENGPLDFPLQTGSFPLLC